MEMVSVSSIIKIYSRQYFFTFKKSDVKTKMINKGQLFDVHYDNNNERQSIE